MEQKIRNNDEKKVKDWDPKFKLFVGKSLETPSSCRSNLSLARWVCPTYFVIDCEKNRTTDLLMHFCYEPNSRFNWLVIVEGDMDVRIRKEGSL